MYAEEMKKYEGKKVLLVLKNNFKYTTILPYGIGTTFTIIDKYGREVTISCEIVQLITGVD